MLIHLLRFRELSIRKRYRYKDSVLLVYGDWGDWRDWGDWGDWRDWSTYAINFVKTTLIEKASVDERDWRDCRNEVEIPIEERASGGRLLINSITERIKI